MRQFKNAVIITLVLAVVGMAGFVLLKDGEKDIKPVVGPGGPGRADWKPGEGPHEKSGKGGKATGESGEGESGEEKEKRESAGEEGPGGKVYEGRARRPGRRWKRGKLTQLTPEQWKKYISSLSARSKKSVKRKDRDPKVTVVDGTGGALVDKSENASEIPEGEEGEGEGEIPPEEEAEAPTRASLNGYVIDEEGRAIEGAKVTLHLENYSPGTGLAQGEDASRFPEIHFTDDRGQFSSANLPPESYKLQVEKQEFVTGYFASLALEPGENYVEIVLDRQFRVAGMVMDENQTPVMDAKVTASYLIEAGISFVSETMTDADGAFSVAVQEGSSNVVTAGKYGYVSNKLLSVPPGKTDCVLVLTPLPMGLVTGRVVDFFTKQPINDITLDGEPHEASDGMFEIERIAQGSAVLRVGASEYPTMTVGYSLSEGQTIDLGEIALCDGLILKGVVSEVGEGATAPIEGASVRIVPWGAAAQTMNTGPDGTFIFENLPIGSLNLRVIKNGYATFVKNIAMAPPDPEKPESREVYIQVQLARGQYSVQGKVTNAVNDEPISGATLQVVELPGLTAASDNGGGYRIDSITRRNFRVKAVKPGFITATSLTLTVTGENPVANCNFALEPGGGIFGRLLQSGSPLPAGVWVGLWKKIEGGAAALHAADANISEHHRAVNTDNNGEFAFQDIPNGDYFLVVPTYNLFCRPVTAGESTNAITIEVPGVTEVSGRIRRADGSPVSNTTIWLHVGDHDYSLHAWGIIHTDADGNYTIPRLAKKKYALSIIKSIADQSAQYLHEFIVNTVPAQTVDVQFPPMTSSIFGRLTDENGQPKPGVQVGVEYLDNPHRSILAGWVKTDDNGSYVVPRLEPGRHVMRTAWTNDEVVFSGVVELKEGETKEVNLVAPKVTGKRVTGYLIGADGGPIHGSFVFAVNESGQQAGNYFATCRWEYTSGFNINGLAPGNWTLIFTAIGYRKKSVQVAVTQDIKDYVVEMKRE
ncbi:MAG: carboxypeptidase regulatory-like domain-containing protein [Planctomycetota bacterium]|nr:MAG: carboxypeptidase regulatory-like domain-containing protein [Planctomycetota bacterium]